MRMNCFGDKVSSSGSFHCKIVLLDEQQLVHEILVSRMTIPPAVKLIPIRLSFVVASTRPSSLPTIYGHQRKNCPFSYLLKEKGKVESERISCIITLTENS